MKPKKYKENEKINMKTVARRRKNHNNNNGKKLLEKNPLKLIKIGFFYESARKKIRSKRQSIIGVLRTF